MFSAQGPKEIVSLNSPISAIFSTTFKLSVFNVKTKEELLFMFLEEKIMFEKEELEEKHS